MTAAWAFSQMEAAASGLGASAAQVAAAGERPGMSTGPANHATHPAAESNGAAGERAMGLRVWVWASLCTAAASVLCQLERG